MPGYAPMTYWYRDMLGNAAVPCRRRAMPLWHILVRRTNRGYAATPVGDGRVAFPDGVLVHHVTPKHRRHFGHHPGTALEPMARDLRQGS
eukprot:1074333-Rhodomonas_salina.2